MLHIGQVPLSDDDSLLVLIQGGGADIKTFSCLRCFPHCVVRVRSRMVCEKETILKFLLDSSSSRNFCVEDN